MTPLLLVGLLLAQVPQNAKTSSMPGTAAPQATNVQGCSGCTPIAAAQSGTWTINSSGAADTTSGPTALGALNACIAVATAGQTSVNFALAAGTLAATLTPYVSSTASADCTTASGANRNATSFLDINGNKSSTLVVTNPNAASQSGIQLQGGVGWACVCVTSYTSGTANGTMRASTPQPPPPAAGADVTDRWARQVGQVDLSRVLGAAMAATNPVWAELTDGTSSYVGAKTGQLPSSLDASGGVKTHEVGTAATSNTALNDEVASSSAANETSTNRLSVTSVLRGLDTSQAANSQLVAIKATANAAWVNIQNSTLAVTQSGSWSLAANQSVNVAQINGVTPLMGNGVTGTGSQRVTIASDNTAFTVNAAESGTWTVQPGNTANTTAWLVAGGKTNNNAAPGATNLGVLGALANASAPSWTEGDLVAESVDLAGNQRVDIEKIKGTATDVNNGTVSAGTQRVTLASDSTGQVKILGQNSAVPIFCGSSAVLDMSTATTTQMVAISGSTTIYVCGWSVQAGGTTNVKLVRGTGTNCATGQANLSPAYEFTAQAGIVDTAGGGNIVLKSAGSDAICATNSAAVNAHIRVSYAQF